MDKEARAGEVWAAYNEVIALVAEGTLTREVAQPIIDALDNKWKMLRAQHIAECEWAAATAKEE